MRRSSACRTTTIAHRTDDALIDSLAGAGLSDAAKWLGVTPLQAALAWLMQRAPNILLIPGTSSSEHLHENLAAAAIDLPVDATNALERI